MKISFLLCNKKLDLKSGGRRSRPPCHKESRRTRKGCPKRRYCWNFHFVSPYLKPKRTSHQTGFSRVGGGLVPPHPFAPEWGQAPPLRGSGTSGTARQGWTWTASGRTPTTNDKSAEFPSVGAGPNGFHGNDYGWTTKWVYIRATFMLILQPKRHIYEYYANTWHRPRTQCHRLRRSRRRSAVGNSRRSGRGAHKQACVNGR